MIAERLRPALRVMEEASRLARCPREESFADLYPLLGDAEAQEEIRRQTPDVAHCAFLRQDPDACRRFPADLAGAMGLPSGEPCPNNSHLRHREVFERLEAGAELIEQGLWLKSVVDLGGKIDPERSGPAQFLIARLVIGHYAAAQRQIDGFIGKLSHAADA